MALTKVKPIEKAQTGHIAAGGIPLALAALGNTVDEASKMLDELAVRLEPAMLPEDPEPSKGNIELTPVIPLVASIRSIEIRVSGLHDRMADLFDRLAL